MSLAKCDMCNAIVDTDESPEGFYVKGYADKYVCESCVENNNLEYEI